MIRIFLYIIFSGLVFSSTVLAAGDDFIINQTITGGSDLTPPTIPSNLTTTPVATSQINLAWDASTDDVLLSGYQVFRDGLQIATSTTLTYADVGLITGTSYSYYVTAFDSSLNVSASSTVSATTTLTSTPVSGSGGAGEMIELVPIPLELDRLEVISDQTSVNISYITKGFVRAVVRWGKSSSYELGSSVERSFSKSHETVISGLNPGTRYQFTIEGENQVGVRGVLTVSTFTTLELDDIQPPANVTNLRAVRTENDVRLSWRNPIDSDFSHVRVLRNDRFFPNDIADGWLIYEGEGFGVLDSNGIYEGERQFYTVFTYDKEGNVSSGAVVSIAYSGVSYFDEETEENFQPVESVVVDMTQIIFIQDGQKLNISDQNLIVDGTKTLTILLPYDVVPEHLKTILFTLTSNIRADEKTSFLLRINEDYSAYEATLAPLGVEGLFPFRISVYDLDTNIIVSSSGAIMSEISQIPAQEPSFLSKLMWAVFSYATLFIILLLAAFAFGVRLVRKGIAS